MGRGYPPGEPECRKDVMRMVSLTLMTFAAAVHMVDVAMRTRTNVILMRTGAMNQKEWKNRQES